MAALAAVIVFSAPVTAEAAEGKIIKSWYSENHFSAFLRLPYDNLSVSDINAGGTKTELTDFRKTDEGDRVHTSVLITPGGELPEYSENFFRCQVKMNCSDFFHSQVMEQNSCAT